MRPRALALSLALGACGRIGFDAGGVGALDDGRGAGSQRRDALGTGIDGATDRPNVVFVTSAMTTGALGGITGANAMCESAATSAGLPGRFVALLSSQAQLSFDLLVGSRGWVRTGDGAPIADTAESLLAGAIFNGIDRDENGLKLAPRLVWTGATTIGNSVENCGEWTRTDLFAMSGTSGGAMPELLSPFNVYTSACAGVGSLYCFEIGHVFEVTPTPASGSRIAFLAPSVPHGTGVATLDAQCQFAANTAGLPGTFLAAVATQGASAASRFTVGMGWSRPDGTAISATSASMFDNSDPLTFINQFADGTYVTASGYVRTGGLPNVAGSNATTCGSWSSTGGGTADVGRKVTQAAMMWSFGNFSCGVSAHTMCLQQ